MYEKMQRMAAQAEARKLRQAGIDPDNAANPNGGLPNGGGNGGQGSDNDDDNDDNDDDDLDQRGQERQPSSEDQNHEGDEAEAERLRLEIARLQNELQATTGRVAPVQRQAEEYRRLWDAERQAREAQEQERNRLLQQIADIEARDSRITTVEQLQNAIPEEVRSLVDPQVLEAMATLAFNAAQANAPKIDVRAELQRELQERETQAVEQYRRRVMLNSSRPLSQLHMLAERPDFLAWTQEEENDDFDVMVDSLLKAKTTEDIDKYGKAVDRRLNKFLKESKQPRQAARTTDPNHRPSLENRMQRTTQGRLTDEKKQSLLKEATRLSRSRSPSDRQRAQEILDKLK